MEDKKAFAVKFQCRNCGYSWWEEFCKGDIVYNRKWNLEGPYVKDRRCTGGMDCPYCRYVKCPVCEAEKQVSVKERKPLIFPNNFKEV